MTLGITKALPKRRYHQLAKKFNGDELIELEQRLADRFKEAAHVFWALPPSDYERIGKLRSSWPDFLRLAEEAYGYHPSGSPRIIVSPQAVSRAEEAFVWLLLVPPLERTALWAWANGIKGGKLAKRFHCTTSTIKNWRKTALMRLVVPLWTRRSTIRPAS